MAQGLVRIDGEERVRPSIVANNSEVFAEMSPVNVDGNGNLIVATAGLPIWGYCTEAFTAIAANETGSGFQTSDRTAARYAPRVIDPSNVYAWFDSDQAFVEADDLGEYADIASLSAGVATLNLTAGTSGQFFVVGLLSDIEPSETDTDRIVVKVAENQENAYAQA